MKKISVFFCVLALFFCRQSYGMSIANIEYEVIKLDIPDGGTWSEVKAINNLGQAVGVFGTSGKSHAFFGIRMTGFRISAYPAIILVLHMI